MKLGRIQTLLVVSYVLIVCGTSIVGPAQLSAVERLRIGVAETDITPPVGFPMAGYFHERLAAGQLDPLKAKAIVFQGDGQQAGLVICDLTGIAVDLTTAVRRRCAQQLDIPENNIIVAATHTHTAPDYYLSLNNYLLGVRTDPTQAAYIDRLIDGICSALTAARASAKIANLESGSTLQQSTIAFNRRFVMRDGTVRTWMSLGQPDVVRAAGPIDPEIGLLLIRDFESRPVSLLSNFALHLDTVGGLNWSGDYPYFIEQHVRDALGANVISVFGTGCCGDINHVNPATPDRNSSEKIGQALGTSILQGIKTLQPITNTQLEVRSSIVRLPLQEVTSADVQGAIRTMRAVASGEHVEFLEHVAAHKHLLLDLLRHTSPLANANSDNKDALATLRPTQTWAGIGETLPVEVHAICIGQDVAIICLPGEVFVSLGLAIKQASPFRTTILVELANSVETCYVPTRAAYAGGSYEVINSTLKPGSGEMLVEESLRLLRQARESP